MDSFLVFVIVVIVWLALGSWGASILTRKNYLSSDSPQVARRFRRDPPHGAAQRLAADGFVFSGADLVARRRGVARRNHRR